MSNYTRVSFENELGLSYANRSTTADCAWTEEEMLKLIANYVNRRVKSLTVEMPESEYEYLDDGDEPIKAWSTVWEFYGEKRGRIVAYIK